MKISCIINCPWSVYEFPNKIHVNGHFCYHVLRTKPTTLQMMTLKLGSFNQPHASLPGKLYKTPPTTHFLKLLAGAVNNILQLLRLSWVHSALSWRWSIRSWIECAEDSKTAACQHQLTSSNRTRFHTTPFPVTRTQSIRQDDALLQSRKSTT